MVLVLHNMLALCNGLLLIHLSKCSVLNGHIHSDAIIGDNKCYNLLLNIFFEILIGYYISEEEKWCCSEVGYGLDW